MGYILQLYVNTVHNLQLYVNTVQILQLYVNRVVKYTLLYICGIRPDDR